jgi:hypothetical protein
MSEQEDSARTKEEKFLDLPPTTNDFNTAQYGLFLDTLFSLGDVRDTVFEIFPGFVVSLRILTPIEQIEVMKKVDASEGNLSKVLILKLETLARCVEKINGQYLRFSDSMIEEWQDFRGGIKDKPTEIEQQRFVLQYRFKQFIIDEIYRTYEKLLKKQEDIINSLKKNSSQTQL